MRTRGFATHRVEFPARFSAFGIDQADLVADLVVSVAGGERAGVRAAAVVQGRLAPVAGLGRTTTISRPRPS